MATKTTDGPREPDLFCYSGNEGRVKSPIVWRFLCCLWNSSEWRVSIDRLAEPVWGNAKHDISYLAVDTLRRESNRFFRAHDIPLRVKKQQDVVRLIGENASPE